MRSNIRHVKTRSGDIAFTDQGEGPPALFVHGVFLNGFLWRGITERLCGRRRCIAIDLLAHGETRTAPNADLSFNGHAEMLEVVCEALDLQQVDLVANDSGGGIAQIFAARDVKWAHWLHATLPGAQPPIILAGARLFFPEERPAALAHALSRFWSGLPPAPQPHTEGGVA